MSIQIYNSLTRKKEEFKPLKDKQVKMYVCGPTVYDEPHIGHARSAYIFDVVRRYLKYRGYKVKFVRNVTDVDDKIIDKARKECEGEDLNAATKKVAEKYLKAYHDALENLGIDNNDIVEPKASEYIPKMVKFIEGLIKKGAAYQSGGDVYFDIKLAKDYGKLSNQSLDKMEAGARVAVGESKKDPLDFALWKAAKEGEPSWKSPWGPGRPGWHIECSVMSSDILGDEFDIHGGGLDLIFPHHENEKAQSEGAGKKFAKYWMHHGLLTINSQKMSKSLGNFVTVTDFLVRHKNADLLKLLFLSAHYSSPVDYTDEKIAEAKEALERILIFMDKARKIRGKISLSANDKFKEIDEVKDKFTKSMDDDFNTPQALSYIFELISFGNKNTDNSKIVLSVRDAVTTLKNVLGLTIKEHIFLPGDKIQQMIEERNEARKKKDFALSDKIRQELEQLGIVLEDTKDGTTWRRKL
ncbi:MAG: cysteine--tRNA ligase [Candidatus Omnitrophica bacterium]|nr:cysteine--tRNA ligase [Candidatus Omnitrophota bacterium]